MELYLPRRPFRDEPPEAIRKQDRKLYPVVEVIDVSGERWLLKVSEEPCPDGTTVPGVRVLTAWEGTWSLD